LPICYPDSLKTYLLNELAACFVQTTKNKLTIKIDQVEDALRIETETGSLKIPFDRDLIHSLIGQLHVFSRKLSGAEDPYVN